MSGEYGFDDYYYYNFTDIYHVLLNECNTIVADDEHLTRGAVLVVSVLGLLWNIFIVVLEAYGCLRRKFNETCINKWGLLNVVFVNVVFCTWMIVRVSGEKNEEWNLSKSTCKFKFALVFICYHATVIFHMLTNFIHLLQRTSVCNELSNRIFSLVAYKWLGSIAVWVVSILINIPIFMFTTHDECKICKLDFPIAVVDVCNWFEGVLGVGSCNSWLTEAETVIESDGADPSIIDLNNTAVELYQCRHDISHYHAIWIYLNFAFFFLIPILVFGIFYKVFARMIVLGEVDENDTISTKSEVMKVRSLVASQITLFVVWLMWHITEISKISGIDVSLKACQRLLSYMNLFTCIFPLLNAAVYTFFNQNHLQDIVRNTSRISNQHPDKADVNSSTLQGRLDNLRSTIV